MASALSKPMAEQITSAQALAILEAWNASPALRAEFCNSLGCWSAYVRSILVGEQRAELPAEYTLALGS